MYPLLTPLLRAPKKLILFASKNYRVTDKPEQRFFNTKIGQSESFFNTSSNAYLKDEVDELKSQVSEILEEVVNLTFSNPR